ncbi:MAG: SDR family oxidoreductase [Actinomycetota bacterium]|nr:SDR family oxidoreductase [Acidimicrobiales bacterium]MEE2805727.1 SDR family oxidoreductase [Actinomycetota bacterium]|tara:strand:+ start:187 stop:876 length:690 start_codon:yes stop_codon:yes gene_type:complete
MPTTVVTGANRGIGLEFVRQCLERGDKVIAGCRNPDEAADLRGLAPAEVLPVDVGQEASIKDFADSIEENIDLLINNAGTSATNLGLERSSTGVLHAPIDLTLDLIRINGLSAASMTRSLLHCLSEGSQVVNITSQIGSMVVGARFDDLPYSTSKAVMNMVTVQLATQLRDKGITVAAFHPGWVRTDMGGSQADISAEESAAGILSTIEQLDHQDSGSFLCWDGSTHPW